LRHYIAANRLANNLFLSKYPVDAHVLYENKVGRCRLTVLKSVLRLKLKCDEPLSKFAFNFNLRRYNKGPLTAPEIDAWLGLGRAKNTVTLTEISRGAESEAIGDNAYFGFSGMYQAPAKSGALRWLAESKTYDRLWV
jgi:hypothetical protein